MIPTTLQPGDLQMVGLPNENDVQETSGFRTNELEDDVEKRENLSSENLEFITTRNHIRWLRATLGERVPRGSIFLRCMIALAPSFLQPTYKYPTTLHPTSWLDGLRGTAALVVFFLHSIYPWWPDISYGYASGPGTFNPLQMPLIRTLIAGGGAVSVFFVISGYVLSCASIKRIRKGDWEGFVDTLAASVFRRWIRLYVPVLVSTFISMIVSWRNWWILLGGVGGAPPLGFFSVQLWDWWCSFVAVSNPTIAIDGESIFSDPYGPQLWTIPREFRGSMVTYLILLGLAKAREAVRFTVMAFLCWYTVWIQQWDLFLFIYGMLLAEFQFFRQESFPNNDFTALERYTPTLIYRHSKLIMHAISISLAVIAIHLISLPTANPGTSPGYSFFVAYTPVAYASFNLTHRYWVCIGAALLLTAILLSPPLGSSAQPLLQRPFRTPFAQYLGYISFGLYVTHYFPVGTIGHAGYEFGCSINLA
ncbi:O-acetyltransferase -1 [Hyphodiscus hymeniophilus]|uniref:O-acetyltransferase -1 n=1 Tax=Hyphodiscus hymeniophilus TaxID=353542 RepID=A0A9P6SPU1_9HELO|nr:O-acetyltransferase -1 [Hyphodiscus hymeniophilus]